MISLTKSPLPAVDAPPATRKEPTIMNGLLTEDLPLTVEVPQIALSDGNLLVRDPDGNKGEWRVTGQRRDDDGHLVVEYTTLGGAVGEFTFPDPDKWVRVNVGQVLK